MVCNIALTHYLHLIHYIGFVGAQFLNSVLLYLILTRLKLSFGSYRYAMLVFTICSMIYSLVEILGQPVAHMKGSMFVVFVDSQLFNLPQNLGQHLASLHCILTGLVGSLLACQFLYRYVVMCKPYFLEYLQGKGLILIFMPAFSVFIVWFVSFYYGMSPNLKKRMYLQEELSTCFHVDTMRIPFVGPMYWSHDFEIGDTIWYPVDIISALSSSVVLVACFVIILFCAYGIYHQIKDTKSHMSTNTLELNRQLFRMLSIQTVIPMATMFTPVGLFVMLPLLGKDIPYLGNLTSSSLAVYPLLEPTIAIHCISAFRKAVFGKFLFKRSVRSNEVWSRPI